MPGKLLLLMKDERYLKALSTFFSEKMPSVEILTATTLKAITVLPLKQIDVIVVASILHEGIWLKALPFLKMAKSFILLAFPDGGTISEKVAKKYGASRLFSVPLNSNELLEAVTLQMNENNQKKSLSTPLSEEFNTVMKKLFNKMDAINYYEFFNVKMSDTVDAIKPKYIEIARKYHPDKFRNAPPDVRKMAYEITKRANEAYSVLSHPNRRRIYDRIILENPDNKRFDFHLKLDYETNPLDTIMNDQARRFVELAELARKEGSLKQALNQLKLAKTMEGGNEHILSMIAELELLLREKEAENMKHE